VRDVGGKDHLCVGFVIGKRRIIRTERRRERRGGESRRWKKRLEGVCVSMCDVQRALWFIFPFFFFFFFWGEGWSGKLRWLGGVDHSNKPSHFLPTTTMTTTTTFQDGLVVIERQQWVQLLVLDIDLAIRWSLKGRNGNDQHQHPAPGIW
jgi:hypothetical protein